MKNEFIKMLMELDKKVKVIAGIVIIMAVLTVVCGVYMALSSQDEVASKYYNRWDYDYISTIDDTDQTVRIKFYENGSAFVNYSDERFAMDIGYISWTHSIGNFNPGKEYKDIDIFEFDSWLALPTDHDTERQMGQVVSKVACRTVGSNAFQMILPNGDVLHFLMNNKWDIW